MAKKVKGERKKGGKRKRITIRPEFKPQIQMPTTPGLRRLAEENHLRPSAAEKRKRIKPENLAAKMIMNQRMSVSKYNTGKFYLSLCNELYGGKILIENAAPLFPEKKMNVCSFPGFKPDIIIDEQLRTTYIEVKSFSTRKSNPDVAHSQFLGYSQVLIENKGAEMFAALFKYGPSANVKLYICRNREGHKCDNRCLVEKLSNMTKSLLFIPHNLLTFLLMLSPSEERDHSTSLVRDFEDYKRPLGRWLTMLHDNAEDPDKAIREILEHATSKYLGLGDFKLDDFYLHDLEVRQRDAPDIYCRNRKIGQIVYQKERGIGVIGQEWKPFIITEHRTPYNAQWVKHFSGNLNDFIDGLGMKKDYQRMIRQREKAEEREAMREEAKTKLQKKPDDGIPI